MIKLTQDTSPEKLVDFERPKQLGDVRAWSYSALKVYEECPYRTYISRVKGVKEPSGPAAERGTQIHQLAEDYVNGSITSLPKELAKFENQFEELASLFKEGKAELEGEWGFDLDWSPVGWMEKETWARVKLDAMVFEDKTSARVIDYKTGKKWGNELVHSQQGLLYAIAAFFKYPDLEYAQTEFWYLDKGETTKKPYTRKDAMVFAPGFHRRAIKMTTETEFNPTPSTNSCKWCSFRKGDEPECRWGVN